jgi:hypothetical protein
MIVYRYCCAPTSTNYDHNNRLQARNTSSYSTIDWKAKKVSKRIPVNNILIKVSDNKLRKNHHYHHHLVRSKDTILTLLSCWPTCLETVQNSCAMRGTGYGWRAIMIGISSGFVSVYLVRTFTVQGSLETVNCS